MAWAGDWKRIKRKDSKCFVGLPRAKGYIENAHYGQPLSKEIKGVACELIGPVIPAWMTQAGVRNWKGRSQAGCCQRLKMELSACQMMNQTGGLLIAVN